LSRNELRRVTPNMGYPITIKLTDRRLGEDASDYDADALEFDEAEEAVA
jgi:hypothetical protein